MQRLPLSRPTFSSVLFFFEKILNKELKQFPAKKIKELSQTEQYVVIEPKGRHLIAKTLSENKNDLVHELGPYNNTILVLNGNMWNRLKKGRVFGLDTREAVPSRLLITNTLLNLPY